SDVSWVSSVASWVSSSAAVGAGSGAGASSPPPPQAASGNVDRARADRSSAVFRIGMNHLRQMECVIPTIARSPGTIPVISVCERGTRDVDGLRDGAGVLPAVQHRAIGGRQRLENSGDGALGEQRSALRTATSAGTVAARDR